MRRFLTSLVTGAVILASSVSPVVCTQASAEAQGIFINEIMAANSGTLRDGDIEDPKNGTQGGAYSDWIEIYNSGSKAVSIKGYTISDDGASWTFPEGNVPAKGYLLVWASDKNKVAKDGQFHTNFKLGSTGETVVLKNPEGTIVDSVKYPALADDQSYGRTSDGGNEFNLLPKASPKSKNLVVIPTDNGIHISGFIKPKFTSANTSVNTGFKVEISENGKTAMTDSKGYFEIKDLQPGTQKYTLRISKDCYLTREIKNINLSGSIVVGTESLPVDMWAGDTNVDEVINMVDITRTAACFNAIPGNEKYKENLDINLDGVINMQDVLIQATNFNKTPDNYPEFIINNPTPSPTPSATPVPTSTEDAWKGNTGTISLGTKITYTGEGISVKGSVVNITAGGDHTVTGTLKNGMIYIDTTDKVKLRLNGANITNSTGPAIYVKNADKAYITLNENTSNSLTDGKAYSDTTAKGALFSNDSLEIKGDGTLDVTGNYEHAIVSDDNITVENGNINVKSAVKDGIHANNKITVNGGTLNLSATKDCIECDGEIIINEGSLAISSGDDAIHAAGDLTINGGSIDVKKCFEGIESKTVLTVNKGKINVIAGEDGLNASGQLVVNGGEINVKAVKDGLDSNGPMLINGGYTVVYGGDMPEGGTDCDSNTFAIKGGTVIGMGGNTSGPTASACTQCSVVLGGAQANSTVSIKKADGTEILNFKPLRTYYTMLFTSPALAKNTTYTLYINGSKSTSFTTNTMVTKAGGIIFGG